MLPCRASFACFLLLGTVGAVSCGGGPTYPQCEGDETCAERGEVCVEGTCQQCGIDNDCASDEQCVGGRCEPKPECTTAGDCPGNQICRSGECTVECTTKADCGTGLKCLNSQCVDENACASDADCGAGAVCLSGQCETQEISRTLSMCTYPTVRFDFNEATLETTARDGLADVAACIQEAGGTLVVEGHADERGTEEYNLALGDKRARAVVDYLARLGVPRSKMEAVSKGEAEPLVRQSNESAWASNRRAEFEPQ